MPPHAGPSRRPGWDPALALLLAAFALVCLVAGAPHAIDYDSAQFELAVGQNDPRLHQPQPPGFVLYVWLLKLASHVLQDPYRALRFLAVAWLVAAAAVLYALAREVAGRGAARFATACFLTSPVVLFHGLTSTIYPADAFASALVALLALHVQRGERRALFALALGAGLAGGLRPTATAFALPLVVFATWRGRFARREVAGAMLLGLAGALAWILLQAQSAGTLADYLRINWNLQEHVAGRSSLARGLAALAVHARRGAAVLVFGLGAARLVLVIATWARQRAASARVSAAPSVGRVDRGFVAAWTLPAIAVLLFYHFPKSGYALWLWPAFCLGLGCAMVRASRRMLAAAAGLDLAAFFLVPTMPICCRADWEIEEALREPRSTLVRRAWVPEWWIDTPAWPAPLRRAAHFTLGKVDFFYDRTRDYDFGGVLQDLRRAGLPDPATLLMGYHAVRAACYELPEQWIVHVDPNRPSLLVSYRDRHGTPLGDTLAIPATVHTLLVEGKAAWIRFVVPPDGVPPVEPPVPLRKRFVQFEVGTQPFDAWYAPPAPMARRPVRVRIVRTPAAS